MSKVVDLSSEFAGCVFGGTRSTDRARNLVDALSQRPNVSISAALQSKADIKGCYRFFDNERVTPAKILEPHIKALSLPALSLPKFFLGNARSPGKQRNEIQKVSASFSPRKLLVDKGEVSTASSKGDGEAANR